MADGRYDRLLDGDAVRRFERFALRVANTPGRERVVLALAHVQDDGRAWKSWLVFEITGAVQDVDRVQLSFGQVYMSDPVDGAPQLPPELEGEAIFEA
ncbi:MAG: hypothetical protein ACRDNS_24815 [Trebonia sp.]